ncbi:MAG: Fumarate reductase/succinate dehydrogenase flavoprotein domain protein [Verrucomicrobia bacterium]|nr:Fumarate reductase/succinate dehydrogenase flavoprotein domain protein [Verrucomicrobiota bacterium]
MVPANMPATFPEYPLGGTPGRFRPRMPTNVLKMSPVPTIDVSCDVLVAGGGLAGVACAIAAARNGARVYLCQDRSVLGGNASSEIRMHAVGANSGRPSQDLVLEARETGIIEEIRLENAVRNPQRSPSVFDLILYEKCYAEKNLTLYLNTTISSAEVRDGRIQRVIAMRPSTEHRFCFKAKVYVDCTGDATLGALAGAGYMQGREDEKAFGESFAVPTADRKTLGSTLLFMARKHDRPMAFVPPPWARKFTERDLLLRTHAAPTVDAGLEYGYWWLEWGGQLDTIRDNEEIRHELMAIVLGMWDHIKNGGDHGAACWALDWFGVVPGKRESRRLMGRYVLTERDVLSSTAFPDAIAYGGWPIDLHPPEGIDRVEEDPCVQHPVPCLYDIPLRCCVARDLTNLMFAGRNISATHVAFASTRVMATCAVIGEGVGVAAAYAATANLEPASLADRSETMALIQRRLLRQDAFLIGQRYAERADLARSASIRASSETALGLATNVISGQNRALLGDRGVPAARQLPGIHRWMSDPSVKLPAWIELRWPNPVTVGLVEIVFDTGLHRHLTLTQSDAYHAKMCWGVPQPETVKSYEVSCEDSMGWRSLVKVDQHWQRRATHLFSPTVSTMALRLAVSETWGTPEARIMRISVYASAGPLV